MSKVVPALKRGIIGLARHRARTLFLCALACWTVHPFGVARSATLAWDENPEPDVIGYRVHYGELTGAYPQSVDVGTNLSFTIPQLTEGVTYHFVVTAYNLAELESDYSTMISYTVPISTINAPPTANDISVQLSENTTADIRLQGSDPDGDPLTFTIQSSAVHGTITGQPPALAYTPDINYYGVDSFTYSVSDGNASSTLATVSIQIDPNALDPLISWSSPAPIDYGTPLGPQQLNAVADTPGSFSYVPASGTVLNAGSDLRLSVTFTPEDPVRFNTVQSSVALDVLPAPLIVTGPSLQKVYGDDLPPLEIRYSGMINGDTPSDLITHAVASTTANAGSNVGIYAITVSGAADPNYVIDHVNGQIEVLPAPLTIQADNKTRIVGEPNPVLTTRFSGLVNGDSPGDLDVAVEVTTTADYDSPPGKYPIAARGARDHNYVIAHNDGELAVNSGFIAKINFQPESTPAPPGYRIDSGKSYSARDFNPASGWNVDLTGATFDKNSDRSPDQRFDTMIVFRESNIDPVWEIETPNGDYEVFLVAGDPENDGSLYSLLVEGVQAVKGKPNKHTRWFSAQLNVKVNDGRLTVGLGNGARKTKLCFLEIVSAPASIESAPPVGTPVQPSIKLGNPVSNMKTIGLSGLPGQLYGIEVSTDLIQWNSMSAIRSRREDIVILDPDSFAEPTRFYRATRGITEFE